MAIGNWQNQEPNAKSKRLPRMNADKRGSEEIADIAEIAVIARDRKANLTTDFH